MSEDEINAKIAEGSESWEQIADYLEDKPR